MAAGAAILIGAEAQAQGGGLASPGCPAGTKIPTRVAQDACQQAYDVYQFMSPQLGAALVGGNATLGQASTLGGLGHFSVGLRGNVVSGEMPQVDNVAASYGGAQSDDFTVKRQAIALPTVDAAIGVFGGIPLGVTRVGGVDLLVNAAYLPEYDGESLDITTPNGSLKLGFGARVGLVQESILVPGVSATYLRRDLPSVDIVGRFDETIGETELSMRDLSVKSEAWRVVASKSFFLFGFQAGAGQDRYETGTTLGATVRSGVLACSAVDPCSTSPVALRQSLVRTNYFGSMSLNLLMLKLVGEVGQVSGGDVETYNTFDGNRADDSRLYGSVAFRFGF
jgi:hypothetical protein